MKPALPKVPVPSGCEGIRAQYADVGSNQSFLQKTQQSIDSFGSYIQNNLEADLQEIARTSSPQYMYQNLVRYIKIEKRRDSPSGLVVNQLIALDDTGSTVSQGKKIKGSGTPPSYYPLANAVNGKAGDKNNYAYLEGQIYDAGLKRMENTYTWIEIDLGNVFTLSKLIYYNYQYNEARVLSWISDYKITLYNTAKEVVKEFFPTGKEMVEEFQVALPTSKQKLVDQKLNQLKATEQELQQAMKCLDLELNQRQQISSDIYNLHSQVKEKETLAKNKDSAVQAARERVQKLRDPYNETTVFESWFPLRRPLEKESVPVLWMVAILFLAVSIGLFLQSAGYNLEFVNTGVSDLSKFMLNAGKNPPK